VYPDDFRDNIQNYLELTGQVEGGRKLTSNTEASGRFHTDWLNIMYPRLKLARNLLRSDGVIFVSCDDHEVHNVRALLNEIFGEENFIATCIWQKRYSRENRGAIGDAHDYLVAERLFYEIEAERGSWSLPELERQIHSFLFARLLKSREKAGVLQLAREGQVVSAPVDVIKHPYVLDFLGLPESPLLRESELEAAIIENLQLFLLELGKGFAFVARQHRVATETQHFYVDLVFYNFLLKCFVLIDLKMGRLTHQEVGQMDMYVRMFDDLRRGEDDNPTVGLILCSERDEVVARYSVLHESRQLFASKYMLYLPSEEELQRELRRERRMIEEARQASRAEREEA